MEEKMEQLINKYSYALPASDLQLRQFADEVREVVLAEIRAKAMGQVINGVLTAVIMKEHVR